MSFIQGKVTGTQPKHTHSDPSNHEREEDWWVDLRIQGGYMSNACLQHMPFINVPQCFSTFIPSVLQGNEAHRPSIDHWFKEPLFCKTVK